MGTLRSKTLYGDNIEKIANKYQIRILSSSIEGRKMEDELAEIANSYKIISILNPERGGNFKGFSSSFSSNDEATLRKFLETIIIHPFYEDYCDYLEFIEIKSIDTKVQIQLPGGKMGVNS